VIDMTNEFVHSLLANSTELAQHRKSEQIEAQDLNFVLGIFYIIIFPKKQKRIFGECMDIDLMKPGQVKRRI